MVYRIRTFTTPFTTSPSYPPHTAPGPVGLARGEPEEPARGKNHLGDVPFGSEEFPILHLRVRDCRQATGREDRPDDPAAAHHTMQVQKTRGATRTGCS